MGGERQPREYSNRLLVDLKVAIAAQRKKGPRDFVGDHPWQAGWPHPRISESGAQTVV